MHICSTDKNRCSQKVTQDNEVKNAFYWHEKISHYDCYLYKYVPMYVFKYHVYINDRIRMSLFLLKCI